MLHVSPPHMLPNPSYPPSCPVLPVLCPAQLHMEMQSNPLFKGCREGMVYFAPTYKYMRNSNNYVGDFYVEGEKRRTPAW